jgi:hypothetical protein
MISVQLPANITMEKYWDANSQGRAGTQLISTPRVTNQYITIDVNAPLTQTAGLFLAERDIGIGK